MKYRRRVVSVVARSLAAALVVVAMVGGRPAAACSTCLPCRLAKACTPTSEPQEFGQLMYEEPANAALPIAPGSWTLAILPDTQIYAQTYPQHFTNQTQWIADNRDSHNIKYVLHEGDIVNTNSTTQWNNARTSLGILDGVVPYALAPGNHDYGPGGNSADRSTSFHNANLFGPTSPYASQPSIGGFFESGKTDNSWHTFQAGGKDWLVIALEFGPRDQVVEWADQVVTDHPDHNAILVTHAYMYYDDTIYDWATKGSSQSWNPHSYGVANQPGGVNDGQELWDKLVKKHENFKFTFNGHVLSDGTGYRATLGDNGNVVHQILANYQMNAQGGQGDMRLLEFLEDGETVEIRTYSPSLDRYNTAADQQFTVKLNELPPPPPVLTHAVAMNLVAVGPTDPTDNIVTAVQFPQFSEPGVSHGQINRGDYQVRVAGKGLTFSQGIMLATISQHDRPDFVNRRASVEPGRNPYGDGQLSLSIMEAGNASDNEVNFNASVAWFAFETGWTGAHVNANGALAGGASNGVTQSMVSRQTTGRYKVDLGVDSRTDGMLFVIANNNDNIVVQTGPFADGNGWDIRVEDNATNHAATGEDRDWSFLYLPYDTPGLIGGHYNGLNNSNLTAAGEFTMDRLGAGQYELTIPGETPETGMLLLSVAHRATINTVVAPDDNILAYRASETGTFLINSYDLATATGATTVAPTLEDTMFVWSFISFENPLSPQGPLSADYNGDGTVDGADFLEWQRSFGETGAELAADGNRDGVVDQLDLDLWKETYGQPAPSSANNVAVPEPASYGLMATAALLLNGVHSRRRKTVASR